MKAACWFGVGDVRIEDVPDPVVLNPRDAILKVTLTAICGSDLHLYNGYIPTMAEGDILGHEFMGEVVEVGPEVKNLAVGDRVVVPFTIACGNCFFCRRGMVSLCDNSNPNAWMAEKLYGYSGSGLFGYSHMMGGYAGGQAQYVRVPFADVGPIKVPDDPVRRAGPLPVGHLPDRVHGRRELRHRGGRRDRRLGMRAGRPDGDPQRVPSGRRARDRDRRPPLSSRRRAGAGSRDRRLRDGGDGRGGAAASS